MKRFIHYPALMLLGFLFVLPASAAKMNIPENWYQIEVIVFSQLESNQQEEYPKDLQLSYPSRLKHLSQAETLFSKTPANASLNEQLAALMVPKSFLWRNSYPMPEAFELVAKTQRQLNPDAYTLRRNNNYRVLFHKAWQQDIGPKNRAPWVYVNGGKEFGEHTELEGSLRVYKSRFFHLETNLWLSQFVFPGGLNPNLQSENPEQERTFTILPEAPLKPLPDYLLRLNAMDVAELSQDTETLNETTAVAIADFQASNTDFLKVSQQLGLDDLRYIDHPRMGMLVLLTKIENEEEDQ